METIPKSDISYGNRIKQTTWIGQKCFDEAKNVWNFFVLPLKNDRRSCMVRFSPLPLAQMGLSIKFTFLPG